MNPLDKTSAAKYTEKDVRKQKERGAQTGAETLSETYVLVGGIPTPLKNMSSSVGVIIPNMEILHHQKDG